MFNPNRTTSFIYCTMAAAVLFFSSCVSAGKPSPTSPGPANSDSFGASHTALSGNAPQQGSAGQSIAASQSNRDSSIKEIGEFQKQASEALQNNKLSEAIKLYISAMARARSVDTAIFERLNKEIALISARLSLEPHESWLSSTGEQLVGNSREAAGGAGLMPAVYLYESYGTGKATVQDAIIRFEFLENSGTLTQNVNTDRFGMANATISSLGQGGKPATIRAYPVFTNEGFSYAFREVFRDFVYLPPRPLVLVAGLEKTPRPATFNQQAIDTAAQSIKKMGLDVAPHSSSTDPELFASAFSGNVQSLLRINPRIQAGYFALLLIEINPPVQLVLQGVTYNIFNTTGKLTLRIVRNDGSIVFTTVKDAVRGQGGNANAAIDDCNIKLQQELTQLLQNSQEAILKAFFE